jgi:hypothetical protein
LYGYENWFIALREEYRLSVSENRMFMRLPGRKIMVTTDWRKLRNEELHNLYYSLNIIRLIKSKKVRWAAEHATLIEEMRNAYKILAGKLEGNRNL